MLGIFANVHWHFASLILYREFCLVTFGLLALIFWILLGISVLQALMLNAIRFTSWFFSSSIKIHEQNWRGKCLGNLLMLNDILHHAFHLVNFASWILPWEFAYWILSPEYCLGISVPLLLSARIFFAPMTFS